ARGPARDRARGTRRPFRRGRSARGSRTACPRRRDAPPPRAAARAPRPTAASPTGASQDRARFGVELLVARGDLAERLQHEAPELAACPGEVVRHLGRRKRELGSEVRVARRNRLSRALDVVALEQREMNALVLLIAAPPQRPDGAREQVPHPLALEELVH